MFASRHTAELALRRMTAGAAATGLLSRLRLARLARAQRRQLARLDAAGLADIGITPDQAMAEKRRPIWDVPASWLR